MTYSLTTLKQAFTRRLLLTVLMMMALASISSSLRAQNRGFIGVADGIFSFETATNNAKKLYALKSTEHYAASDLFQDSQGTIWGLTQQTDEDGAIFKVNPDGTSITFVHFFRKQDGSQPRGSLMEANGKLWGTTYAGGTNNLGTIFMLNLNGSGLTTVFHFTNATGERPGKNLVFSNNRLWGMTYEGGSEDGGVIFSLDPQSFIDGNGADYQIEHNFYTYPDAGYPEGGLIEVGNTLWGLSSYGGVDGYGAIFSIDNDGTNYQLHHSFEYSSTDGATPLSNLVEFNNRIWGLASEGGANDIGTLFGINPDGSGYTTHYSFDDIDAGSPSGSLVVSNGKLWGTSQTKSGASGSIFSFDVLNLATEIVSEHTFNNTNGSTPMGSLIDINNQLWGMTPYGGSANKGSIFRIDNNGTNFSSIYSFSLWPQNPICDLLEYDGKLWGVTAQGGDNGNGVIYTLDREGKNLAVVYSFGALGAAPNGTAPRGGLIQKDGKLYGLTTFGGDNNLGTFYRFDPSDNSVAALYSFSAGGFPHPTSGLFEFLGEFYGTLGGNAKVIFRIQPDGTGFQNLVGLPGTLSDISLQYNGRLWGTERGSAQVFYYDIFAAEYNLAKDFTSTFDGSSELPRLTQYQGRIYGVTHNDGANSQGSVFSMNSDGGDFLNLLDFNGTAGSFPVGKLVTIDDVIYGATRNGGSNNKGVLYKLNLTGPTNYTVIRNFNQADQSSPAIFNFINIKYAPVFLAQFPDQNLQEDHDPVIIDLTQYVYDVEDDIENMTVNITGTGTGKSYVPVSYSLPSPKLTIYAPENNFGSSDITVEITDSDNNTISTSFTVNVAPVADGIAVTNFNQSITYPAMSDPITISGLAVDEDDLGNNSVTHFQITEINGGQVFLNDGTTELVNGSMVPLNLGTLKFTPSGAGSGSFKVQASVSPDVSGLGGFIFTANISTGQGTPQITWNNPSALTYGDVLSTVQLGATSDVAGTFIYQVFKSGMSLTTVSEGTLLSAGVYTLRATFNPSDTDNYYQVVTEVSLTVNKAPLTITADDITRVYGSYTPLTVTYEGFVNNEGPAQLPYEPGLTYLHSQIDAGTYDILFEDVPNPANYTISTVPGTLIVTKAPLTISVANATKVYGSANPTFQLQYSGFVNFDNSDDLDSQPVVSTTAVINSPVGVYPISVSGAADINYNITYVEGNLTITKKTTEVVASNVNKRYGEPNPLLTVEYTGLISGDTPDDIDVQVTASVAADEFSDAGNYLITLSGGSDNNYTLSLRNDSYLHIFQKPLTVGVQEVTTTYGTLPTTYNLTFDGFVNGDGPEDIDVLPEYTVNLPAKPIPGSFGTGLSRTTPGSDNNYILYTANYGTVVVTKAPLEIKAANVSIAYGDAIPTLPLTYTGFVNGDNESSLSVLPTATTNATASSNAGTYSITLTGGSSRYYELTLVGGTITINKKQAAVTISNLKQVYTGEEISVQVATNPAGLNVTVTYNGTSSKPMAVGSYDIKAVINDTNHAGEASATLVIDAITAVEDRGELIEVNVYPNPVVDFFSISGIKDAPSLRVFNTQGQLIITKSNIKEEESIDVRNFSPGTYIILIDYQGQSINRKIIKQ